MPCPGEGPCGPWDLDLSCCLVSGGFQDPCLGDGTPVPQVIIDQMILASSQYLWARTGRQYGCCQITIRPTQNPRDCGCESDNLTGYPWTPVHLANGDWTNVSCFCGEDPCGCPAEPCSIRLPYPVCSIDQVKVDGQIIGKSLYRVDDFRELVLTPGFITNTEDLTNPVGPLNGPVVDGPVTVTGPGTAGGSGGFIFPQDGQNYNINLGGCRRDLVFEFQVDPGTFGNFNFALSGGDFDLFPGEGHFSGLFDPPLLKTGINVRYSTPGDAGSVATFFIVANDSGCNADVNLQRVLSSSPDGLKLISVNWTEVGSGMDCWPKCNDLSKTDDEVGTMSVTLTYGRPVPELLKLAAQEFACQLIKKCVGKPCDLPQRVTSISRQGMNASFLDPMEFMKEGLTGIFLVDLAIKTYNPHGLYKKPWVGSPDSINNWRVTTWENKPGGREDPIGPNCT